MAELTIATRTAGAFPLVELVGEIDVYHGPRLRAHLDGLIAAGTPDLILDLTQVSYIDSTGLGILVAVRKAAIAAGGGVRLICPRDSIRRVFEITGLLAAFTLHPDEASALSASSG